MLSGKTIVFSLLCKAVICYHGVPVFDSFRQPAVMKNSSLRWLITEQKRALVFGQNYLLILIINHYNKERKESWGKLTNNLKTGSMI